MAITRNLVVMLKDDVAKPKEKMFVYRDDVGVEMVIELKDFDYSIDTVGNRNNIQKAYALFRTPTKKTYQYTNIKISNGKLVFTFSQDIVNVMQEIGEYELQFQLYDKEDNRLTIPSYNFYVKEPLTIDGELVDTAVVDESVIVDLGEEKDYIFVITDGYIKTKWRTGDLITKERLNKVENALSVITDAVNSKVGISQLHNHGNKEILDTISANKISEWDNKSNFNGDYNSLTNKPTIPTKVSDLPNDSGYLTEHQDISGKVDKVNGYSLVSDVEISRLATLENYDDTKVHELINKTNTSLDKSVKFKVVGEGIIVPPINGGGSYILPIATNTRLGGVKIGNNLSIDSNGVLSAITSDKVDKVNGYSLVSDAEISRLATLENYDDTEVRELINETNTSLENIKNNGANLNIEPQLKDIPKVFFNGDITGMSGDNEKKIRIRYSSETLRFDEYCTMKWQGSSSLNFPKKNYTIKLFKDSECTSKSKKIFRNWIEANKFCLKANYIDSTHARNIVTAKLSRELYNEKLPMECQGTIDGFPIWVYINGVLQGLYTWNIPKDGKQMYGMSEDNPNHLMYVANRNANKSTTQDWASQFRTLATDINEDTANGWEEEFPQTCSAENMAKLNRLISFVKDSTDEVFKRDFTQYMDLDYAISYWIYAYVGCMADNLGNNMIIITYDGLKWYPVFYDVDSVWGLKWDGSSILSDTYQCPKQYQENRSLLWEKLVRNFPTEIYNKYKELRKNVLSEEYIFEKFERFIDIIPNEKYTKDQTIWSNIPSKNYNIDQIREYVPKRMSYCDVEFAKLVAEPSEPSEPIDVNNFTIEQNGVTNNINFINQNGAFFDETKGCYAFTGDNKYIQVDFSGLDKELTLELIIDDSNSGNTVIAEGIPFAVNQSTFTLQSDRVQGEQSILFRACGSNGTENNRSYFKSIAGTKYHLIYTIDVNNNILKSFINGVKEEDDFTNISIKPNLNGLTGMVFGSRSGQYGCKNNIYLIKIYDRVLTDDEALQRYNQCKPSESINVIGHFDTTNNFSNDLSGNDMVLNLTGYNQSSNAPLVLETGEKRVWIQDDRFASKYTIEIDFETTATNEGFILNQCSFESKGMSWSEGYMFGVSSTNKFVIQGNGFNKTEFIDNVVGVRHKFRLSYNNGTISCNIDNKAITNLTKTINVDCLYFGSNGVDNAFRGQAKIYSIKIWV